MSAAAHTAAIGPGVMELIQLANLLVVVALIYFGTRKGITAAVKSRSDMISRKIHESKNELERVQADLLKAKKEFAQVDQLKVDIMKQVKAEGDKLAASILADARVVSDRIISDTKIAADNEVRSAAKRLKKDIVEQAIARSTELLQASASGSHERLLQKFAAEASLQNNGGSQ